MRLSSIKMSSCSLGIGIIGIVRANMISFSLLYNYCFYMYYIYIYLFEATID